jgi:hypothetical protein
MAALLKWSLKNTDFCKHIDIKGFTSLKFQPKSADDKYTGKGKVHPCTGTEALYRPCSP